MAEGGGKGKLTVDLAMSLLIAIAGAMMKSVAQGADANRRSLVVQLGNHKDPTMKQKGKARCRRSSRNGWVVRRRVADCGYSVARRCGREAAGGILGPMRGCLLIVFAEAMPTVPSASLGIGLQDRAQFSVPAVQYSTAQHCTASLSALHCTALHTATSTLHY